MVVGLIGIGTRGLKLLEPVSIHVIIVTASVQSKNSDLGLWNHILDSDFGLRISDFELRLVKNFN